MNLTQSVRIPAACGPVDAWTVSLCERLVLKMLLIRLDSCFDGVCTIVAAHGSRGVSFHKGNLVLRQVCTSHRNESNRVLEMLWYM